MPHAFSKEEVDDCKKYFSGTLRESHCNVEKEFEAVLEVLKFETRIGDFKSGAYKSEVEDFKVQNQKNKYRN